MKCPQPCLRVERLGLLREFMFVPFARALTYVRSGVIGFRMSEPEGFQSKIEQRRRRILSKVLQRRQAGHGLPFDVIALGIQTESVSGKAGSLLLRLCQYHHLRTRQLRMRVNHARVHPYRGTMPAIWDTTGWWMLGFWRVGSHL